MGKVNKYGLSRAIPENIKREVRQRCGFGCVICGNALYEYEHIEPSWCDAKSHESTNITLLCGNHHNKVTRKFLSKESVKKADCSPFCKNSKNARDILDVNNISPIIEFGPVIFKNVKTLIEIFDDKIFSILPPEEGSDKFLISAFFSNKQGKEILRIEKNEIFILNENWDAEYKAGSIVLKNTQKEIILDLKVEPPNKFLVKKLHMQHKGVRIDAASEEGKLNIKFNGEKSGMITEKMEFEDVNTAFFVGKDGHFGVARCEPGQPGKIKLSGSLQLYSR